MVFHRDSDLLLFHLKDEGKGEHEHQEDQYGCTPNPFVELRTLHVPIFPNDVRRVDSWGEIRNLIEDGVEGLIPNRAGHTLFVVLL